MSKQKIQRILKQMNSAMEEAIYCQEKYTSPDLIKDQYYHHGRESAFKLIIKKLEEYLESN